MEESTSQHSLQPDAVDGQVVVEGPSILDANNNGKGHSSRLREQVNSLLKRPFIVRCGWVE